MEPISVLLSSSVVSALVAALISVRINERKIQIKNVTQERAKWRNTMRALSDSIVRVALADDIQSVKFLSLQLELNVNPFDDEDKALVQLTKQLASEKDAENKINEFNERMALLLKHDWDRAKREARPWFFRGEKPRRVPYNEFKQSCCSTTTKNQTYKTIKLVFYFVMLGVSAGLLFSLAVGLTEPFKELVLYFNDPQSHKSHDDWLQFVFWSSLFGTIWTALYLWFKGSEKRFLEVFFTK